MATNRSTLKILNRLNDLIDELYAMKRDVLRYHVRAQTGQNGQFPNDDYVYDTKKKKYRRVTIEKKKKG